MVNSYKMGPGTLTLGSSPLDVSAQVTSCKVAASENVSSEDAIPVLSGDEIPGEEDVTLEWAISGTFVQDLALAGVVAYTWTNASDWVAFHFVPNTTGDRAISGECRLIPLDAGGDVKSRPTSDFEWRARGAGGDGTPPVLADATP